MAEYKKQTDEVQVITLESKIVQALWCNKLVLQEEKIDFEVWTQFVGNGSKIQIKVEDKKGKSVAKAKGEVYGNYFAGSVVIPKKAKEEITFTAKLPKHSLEMKSNTAKVIPKVELTNQKWSQEEARRGDLIKLTADVEGAAEELEIIIYIYEHDQDSAHDFITKFPTTVKDNKIEAEWVYEYHEDTDEIPTDEEMTECSRNYSPPEYFWVGEIGSKRFGDEQESGLLEFKDSLDINLVDANGEPISDMEYTVTLADGSEREGRLGGEGEFSDQDIPPGRSSVRFNYSNDQQDN